MHDDVTRVLVTREAGHVRRCHVVPHHGEYTVGLHSYNALSMLLVLHPDPPMHLVKAMLWHDGAERWVGDMPAPAKWYEPALGEAYNMAEMAALQAWDLYEPWESMTDEDRRWLEAIDRLELWLWCQDQLMLGNQHIQGFIRHLNRYFKTNRDRMPTPCWRFYKDFSWKRLPETYKIEDQ